MSDDDSPIFEPDDELAEADVQSEVEVPSEADVVVPSERLPGPGFLESLGWTFSALVLHIIGGMIAGIFILFLFVSENGGSVEKLQQLLNNQEQFEAFVNSKPCWLIGLEMSTFVLGVLFLVLLRLGRDRRRAVPLSLPNGWHVALTVLWVVPLSMVCSQIGVVAGEGWDQITRVIPSLQELDKLNIMESIGDIVSGMPRWQVYLWIAVAPAVGEELLFRVLIGRGLVARYGMVAGIALTTFFFASVHFHPVHMVALIPLSIAIHISYLASRSIWVPILAHFLNNAWAVTIMLGSPGDAAELTPAETMGDALFPWWLILSSVLVSVSIGVLYWKSRLHRFRSGGGEPLRELGSRTFVSADRNLSDPNEQYAWRPPSFPYYAALAATVLFFGITLAVHLRNVQG